MMDTTFGLRFNFPQIPYKMPHFTGEVGQRYRILWRPGQGPADPNPNRYAGSGKYDGTSSRDGHLVHKFIDAIYYSSATGQEHIVSLLPFLDFDFRENGGKFTAIKENPESKEVMSGGRRRRRTSRHARKRRATRTRRHR